MPEVRRDRSHRASVTSQRDRVQRGPSHRLLEALGGVSCRLARVLGVDPRQSPDRVDLRRGAALAAKSASERLDRPLRVKAERLDRPLLDRDAFIVEKAHQLVGCRLVPVDSPPARIFARWCADSSHAVDAAEHVRLSQLRRRTADLVPPAGVRDQETAVRVLEDIGRMEVAAL